MSSEQDQSGWQLSQEQFQFIEDTLKDALLQQVDRRVEEFEGPSSDCSTRPSSTSTIVLAS